MIITHDKNKITHPYFNDPSNRWLHGLTNEQHHNLPAISSSAVKYFHKKSPWAFYKKYVLRTIKNQELKPEFKIGTLIHLAILEPEIFEKTVFVCNEAANTVKYKELRKEILDKFGEVSIDVSTKISIETSIIETKLPRVETQVLGVYEEAALLSEKIAIAKKERAKRNSKKSTSLVSDNLPAEIPLMSEALIRNSEREIIPSKNGGYLVNDQEVFIIKSHEMKMLKEMQQNVRDHDRASLMLGNCQYIEQSGIAQCPKTGLFLSLRGDARSELGYFIDPKSANELSIHGMESSQAAFSYFLQHAHYLYVANLIEPNKYDRFYFLYISKEAPYEVCLTHLKEEDVEKANKLYFDILNRIAECEYKQKWPTLDNGNGLLLNIPRWAM